MSNSSNSDPSSAPESTTQYNPIGQTYPTTYAHS